MASVTNSTIFPTNMELSSFVQEVSKKYARLHDSTTPKPEQKHILGIYDIPVVRRANLALGVVLSYGGID